MVDTPSPVLARVLQQDSSTSRLLLFTSLTLALAVMALAGFIVFDKTTDSQAIYRVNFGLPGIIEPNAIPATTIEQTAAALMVSATNYSPHSVKGAFEYVGRFLHPKLYAQWEQWAGAEAAYVKASVVSSISSISQTRIEEIKTGFFKVDAMVRRTVHIGSGSTNLEEEPISMTFMVTRPGHEQNSIGMWLVSYKIPQHSAAAGIVLR